jgi:hypothetical protein
VETGIQAPTVVSVEAQAQVCVQVTKRPAAAAAVIPVEVAVHAEWVLVAEADASTQELSFQKH